MKTIYLEQSQLRMATAKALGPFWNGVYLSNIGPIRCHEFEPPPLPGPDHVRVKNLKSSICGSDLHMVYLDADPRVAPALIPGNRKIYLGHELCGEIIETGKNVKNLKVGDRVAIEYTQNNCLIQKIKPPCRHCKTGNYYLCENQSLKTEPFSIGGGWSDEMLVHKTQLYRIPEKLSIDDAVLMEPTTVGIHAVLKAAPISGDEILIIGCGIIGLLTIQVLKALVPGVKITAVARHPFQASLAREYGAEVSMEKDLYELTAKKFEREIYTGMIGGKMILGGFDIIFDCVGTNSTITNSLRCARAGGTVVLLGINLKFLKVDLNPVWYQEVRLIGTMAHGLETYKGRKIKSFDIAADLLLKKKIRSGGLLTHSYPVEEWKQAVRTASDKKKYQSIKVAITF